MATDEKPIRDETYGADENKKIPGIEGNVVRIQTNENGAMTITMADGRIISKAPGGNPYIVRNDSPPAVAIGGRAAREGPPIVTPNMGGGMAIGGRAAREGGGVAPNVGGDVAIKSPVWQEGVSPSSELMSLSGEKLTAHGNVLATRESKDGTKLIVQMSDGTFQSIDKATGASAGAGTWGDSQGGGVSSAGIGSDRPAVPSAVSVAAGLTAPAPEVGQTFGGGTPGAATTTSTETTTPTIGVTDPTAAAADNSTGISATKKQENYTDIFPMGDIPPRGGVGMM